MDNDRHLDDPDGNGGDGVLKKDEEDVDDDDEVDADGVDHNINEVDIDVVNKRMRKMLMMLATIMLMLMSMKKKLKLMSSLGPRPRRSVGGEGAQGDLGFRGLFQDITTSASSTSQQISLILGIIQNSLIYSQIALANIYEEKMHFIIRRDWQGVWVIRHLLIQFSLFREFDS